MYSTIRHNSRLTFCFRQILHFNHFIWKQNDEMLFFFKVKEKSFALGSGKELGGGNGARRFVDKWHKASPFSTVWSRWLWEEATGCLFFVTRPTLRGATYRRAAPRRSAHSPCVVRGQARGAGCGRRRPSVSLFGWWRCSLARPRTPDDEDDRCIHQHHGLSREETLRSANPRGGRSNQPDRPLPCGDWTAHLLHFIQP